MEPERTPTDWQQPNTQPSQAPYVAPPQDAPAAQGGPVVSLQPDANQQPTQPPAVSSSDVAEPASADAAVDDDPVRWQALEYIQRDKSLIWFIVFGIVFVAVMIIAIFVIKSITFDILVPIMAASLLMYVYRPPRILDYVLSSKGLFVNDHLYPFVDFKSFGVIKDDEQFSILLVPIKRFKPGVSIYFPEEVGETLVDMLGARLPMQELKLDIIDRVIRKLRI